MNDEKEENKKSMYQRWKEGLMAITPEQQLKAKCTGLIGTIVGLLLAFAVMLYRGIWYFAVFMVFLIFLQVLQYIGAKQQLEQAKIMMAQIKAQEADLESAKIDQVVGNVR